MACPPLLAETRKRPLEPLAERARFFPLAACGVLPCRGVPQRALGEPAQDGPQRSEDVVERRSIAVGERAHPALERLARAAVQLTSRRGSPGNRGTAPGNPRTAPRRAPLPSSFRPTPPERSIRAPKGPTASCDSCFLLGPLRRGLDGIGARRCGVTGRRSRVQPSTSMGLARFAAATPPWRRRRSNRSASDTLVPEPAASNGAAERSAFEPSGPCAKAAAPCASSLH